MKNYGVFDGVVVSSLQTNSWASTTAPSWIAYEFDQTVNLYKINLQSAIISATNNNELKDFKLQYSLDGTTWTDATSTLTFAETVNVSYNKNYIVPFSQVKAKHWRLYCINNVGANSIIRVTQPQFYGK